MKLTIKFAILLLIGCVAAFTSCTKTKGDAYKQFMEGGEITYPGRADSVLVQSGYKKVQLAIVMGNDPGVNKLRIYWNNQLDSLDVNVNPESISDTLKVIIPGLNEGNYNFTVYTFDSKGNRSVVSNGAGIVYGDSYLNSLTNRTLQSVAQTPEGNVQLSWGESAGGELGIEIKYQNSDGADRTIITPATETTTTLTDYKGNTELTYQSLYKPDSTAFEFFSVGTGTTTLPPYERQFLKSGFRKYVLPTDVVDNHGWLMEYLWNENYNPAGFATQNQVPCWFTFDSGESASVNRFKVWQANDRLYVGESVKTFELYGSNNPASDGSWASWTKIGGEYTSVKPSGLPVGQNSQADVDFAKAGEEFTAPAGTPKFRYFRFKLLTNWGNAPFMTMEEITFYTTDKP